MITISSVCVFFSKQFKADVKCMLYRIFSVVCVFCEFDVRDDMDFKIERSWFNLGLQTWRVNIFPWYNFHRESVFRVNSEYGNTLEPV